MFVTRQPAEPLMDKSTTKLVDMNLYRSHPDAWCHLSGWCPRWWPWLWLLPGVCWAGCRSGSSAVPAHEWAPWQWLEFFFFFLKKGRDYKHEGWYTISQAVLHMKLIWLFSFTVVFSARQHTAGDSPLFAGFGLAVWIKSAVSSTN